MVQAKAKARGKSVKRVLARLRSPRIYIPWLSQSLRHLRPDAVFSAISAMREVRISRQRLRRPERHGPLFEILEPRIMLSNVSWITPAGGDWGGGANWSTGTVPGTGDTAIVMSLNPGARVTHSTGNSTVAAVQASSPLEITGGTLTVTGATQITGTTLTLDGGTLSDTTLSTASGGVIQTASGSTATLDAATLDSNLTVASNSTLDIADNLTLGSGAAITVDAGGTINFVDGTSNTQTVSGNGTITLAATSGSYAAAQINANGATSGSSVTFANGVNITGLGTGTAPNTLTAGGGNTIVFDDTVTQATISAASGGMLQANGAIFQGVTLTGTLDVTSGTVTLEDYYNWSTNGPDIQGVNNGIINVASGATLYLSNYYWNATSSWTDAGTINIAGGGTLNLGGDFTQANLGTINNTGGTIDFSGRLTNTGGNVSAVLLNSWTMDWGAVIGGTVGASGNTITLSSSGVSLEGVTLQGTVNVNGGYLYLEDYYNYYTSGPDIQGVNNGTINVASGATLYLSNYYWNATSSTWTNASGTINIAGGGTLNLGGDFTQANLGTINNSGGTIDFSGRLANTGGNVSAALLNSWVMDWGTIVGGTVGAGGQSVNVSSYSLNLYGVMLAANVSVASGATLGIGDGLTMQSGSAVTVASGGTIDFGGWWLWFFGGGNAAQAIGGTGRIIMQAGSTAYIYGGPITLDSGIALSGAGQILREPYSGNGLLINQGTIDANVGGQTLTIAAPLQNDGTLTTANGGNLAITGAGFTLDSNSSLTVNTGSTVTLGAGDSPWINSGIINISGGTLDIGGLVTTADLGLANWHYTAGQVELTGTIDNTGYPLTLNGVASLVPGGLELTNGQQWEAAGAFDNAPVNVSSNFTSDFSFQLTNANADGFTFTIQGQGPQALGRGEGDLGYGGIDNSIAIKFDLYQNQGDPSNNSTGIFYNGYQPIGGTSLNSADINLHSGDIINVQVGYTAATNTLTVTEIDATTNTSLTQTYSVNIANYVGAVGWAGFTAGSGFLTATQQILSWSVNGSAVNLANTANSSADVLNLSPTTTGSLLLNGGTIRGGTITATGGVGLEVVPTAPAPVTLADSGFETPVLAPGAYQREPSGTGWNFPYYYTGIAANGSTYTSANPNAPQGNQVGYIEYYGQISQSVNFTTAGTYTLSLLAAQRANVPAAQTLEIQIDGQTVDTFIPQGTNYQQFTTPAFTVSAGTHTITILGLDNAGGDNTALIDSVTINPAIATLDGVTLNSNLTVESGTTLNIADGLTMGSGTTITVDAGGTLNFVDGTSNTQTVSGSGTINLDAAGGSYAAAQLNADGANSGSQVTFDNGVVISGPGTINAATGNTIYFAGTVQDAMVSASSGGYLRVDAEYTDPAFFNGVTVAGNILFGWGGNLIVTDGLTLANNATLYVNGGYSSISFRNGTSTSQTLGGTGTIQMAGTSPAAVNAIWYTYSNSTLTIDPGITITGTGLFESQTTTNIINEGTIRASGAAGYSLSLEYGNLTNSGALGVASGNTLVENASTFVNEATGAMNVASGGTMDITTGVHIWSTDWTNSGTITVASSGTLNLGGNFTTAGIGTINSSGTVDFSGKLANTSNTLSSTMLNTWTMDGGTITGGTVGAGGTAITASGTNLTLDNVTLDSNLTVAASETLNIADGLTLGGGATITVDAGGTLNFVDGTSNTQSVSGSGTITLAAGGSYAAAQLNANGATSGSSVTFANGVNITGLGTGTAPNTLTAGGGNTMVFDNTVTNANLASSGGYLQADSSYGSQTVFNAVTLSNNLSIGSSSGSGATLDVVDGLTFANGAVLSFVGSNGTLAFVNGQGTSQTVSGSGTIQLTNSTASGALTVSNSTSTVTVDSGVGITMGSSSSGGFPGFPGFPGFGGSASITIVGNLISYGAITSSGGNTSISGSGTWTNYGGISAGTNGSSGSSNTFTISSNVQGYAAFNADGGVINFSGGTSILNADSLLEASGSYCAIDLSGATVTVEAAISANTVNFSGGTINGTGSVNLSGTGNIWSGGTEDGVLNVASGAVLNVTGNVYLGSSGVTGAALDNAGTVNMISSGNFYLYDNAAINNETSGTFDIENAGYFYAQDATNMKFNNAGILEKTVNTGTSTLGSYSTAGVALVNASTGTVVVDSGTLQLNAGGSNANTSGTAFTAAGGILNFNNETFTLNGNTTIRATGGGQVELNWGTLTTNGILTINALDFSGGTINGTGSVNLSGTGNTWSGGTDDVVLNVAGGAVLNVTGGVYLGSSGISGAALDNAGTVNMISSGNFYLYDAAAINNETSGTFDVADYTGWFSAGDATAVAFNNYGIFETTTGAGNTSFHSYGNDAGVTFNNESAGTVVVDAGTLQFNAGGINYNPNTATSPGGPAFTVNGSSSVLEFYGAFSNTTFTLESDTTIDATGGGQVELNWGTLTTNGILTINALDFSGGTINGTGSVSLSGPSNTWSGGTEDGILTVASGAVLNVTGGVYLGSSGISGAALDNAGTVNMTSNGNFYLYDNAAINNETSGTFDVADYTGWFSAGDTTAVAFDNYGVFETTTGAVNTSFNSYGNSGVMFNNECAGTLNFAAGGTNYNPNTSTSPGGPAFTVNGSGSVLAFYLALNSDTFTLQSNTTIDATGGGQVELNWGTLTTNGILTVNGFNFNGGLINGTGSVLLSGTDTWSAGTTDAPILVETGATLDIAMYTPSVNGATLTNDGTVEMTNDGELTLSNKAQIDNYGTYNIENSASFSAGDTTAVAFNNYGVFETTTGAVNTSFTSYYRGGGVVFNNESTGMVAVDAGTLQFQVGGTNYNPNTTTSPGGPAFTVNGSGSVLEFNGASTTVTFTLQSNTTIDAVNGGQMELSWGNLVADANVTTSSLVINGGTLTTAGVLTVSGLNFANNNGLIQNATSGGGSVVVANTDNSWTDGTISSLAVTLENSAALSWNGGTLASGSMTLSNEVLLTIGATGTPVLSASSLTVVDGATVTVSADGMNLAGAAQIDNQHGAVFNFVADGNLAVTDSSTPVFTNEGLVEKTGGTGPIGGGIGAELHNNSDGLVNAASGRLLLAGGGTDNGIIRATS